MALPFPHDTYSPWTKSRQSVKISFMKPARTLAADQKALQKAFGDKVRVERRKQGLSQEELADRCKLDRTYIGGIERGERNPSLKNISRIAMALKVPIHSLFSDSK